MISFRSAASIVAMFFEIVPAPAVSFHSPAARPEFTTTPPFAPLAPRWMCMMLSSVVAGQPLTSTSNLPLFVALFSVTVAVPLHDASALVIGGTSSVESRFAVKRKLVCGVGAGVAVVGAGVAVDWLAGGPPQAARARLAARPMARRFMQIPP
jgi:hypothetical protein